MPDYTFVNKISGKEFTKHLKMSEREKFLSDNPDIKQILKSFSHIKDGWSHHKNTSGVMRDRIKEIKNYHHGSTINTKNSSEI